MRNSFFAVELALVSVLAKCVVLSLNTWLEIKVVIILCWLGKIVALFLLMRHATWPKDTFTSVALDTFCRFHCI